MLFPIPSALAFALSLPMSASAAEPAKPPTFALVQAWAGSDAASLGFTQERVVAFLNARKADLAAARQPQWSDWLKELEGAKNPSLKAWALARRVEAGDFTAFPAFQNAISEHLFGISKPGSGRGDRIIADPPSIKGVSMPDALRIEHTSVFWQAFWKTLQSTPERKLAASMYAVWCFGTHPDQKDLILELAAQVETPLTLRNPNADPWNDPRFWIVLDWAMAWGTREDFESIQKALPKGPPQMVFHRTFASMDLVPGFFKGLGPAGFGDPLAVLPGPAAPSMRERESADPLHGPIKDFHFSQIKVTDQPPAPHYPQEAKDRKMMTNLVLTVVVDPQGKPTSVRPVPGPWLGFFAPTGITYGMSWRFRAAELNGVPQYARFRLTMPFRLRL